MFAEVLRTGVGYCNVVDGHKVVISISDAKIEALIVIVWVVAGSFVEGSDFTTGDVLWVKFKVEKECSVIRLEGWRRWYRCGGAGECRDVGVLSEVLDCRVIGYCLYG